MTQSFSELDTWGRCPKMWKYKYLDWLQPKKQPQALYLGTAFHQWAFARITGDTNFVPEKFLEILDDAEFDLIENMIDMWWAEFSGWWAASDIISAEETYEIEFDDRVFTFTPDAVVRDPDGQLCVVDFKTAASIPEFAPPMDLQALMYMAGIKAAYGEQPVFIWEYVRKRTPTIPRLVKRGKKRIANLEKIDTTPEIMLTFMQAHDLTDSLSHRARLATLRAIPNRFVRRVYYRVPEASLDTIWTEALMTAEQIDEAVGMDRFPRVLERTGYRACEKCSYLNLCNGELRGFDLTEIKEQYEPRTNHHEYEYTEEEL